MSKLQAVRGMNDILPSDSHTWQFLETQIKQVLDTYGYQEVRLPIVEKSELFHRGVGEGTDIVEKETYDFIDRNQESLTLRPEGTAGCVRAMIEHGLLRNQQQKVWYLGQMFRHERPQKGRYRQFYQLGVEVYGNDHIATDAELLAMTWQLWKSLGIDQSVTLELNNLGEPQERTSYTTDLVNYLTPLKDQLDEDSVRRLGKNPLRILDSKNPQTQALLVNAPKLTDYISAENQQAFHRVCDYLDQLGVPYRVNPHLVRGLDYYSGVVFEWVTDALGAQGTICAGGRYDKLVAQLGGGEVPATGFAMGMERILLLLETLGKMPQTQPQADIFVISDDASIFTAMSLINQVRQTLPHCRIVQNMQLSGMKAQFKKADKSGAQFAIILAENEVAQRQAVVKPLRGEGEQVTLAFDALAGYFQQQFQAKS